MSGLLALENSDKSAVFRHVQRRSFASVHRVSVVNLWSVPQKVLRTATINTDHRWQLLRRCNGDIRFVLVELKELAADAREGHEEAAKALRGAPPIPDPVF
jgi:hypothetical protein